MAGIKSPLNTAAFSLLLSLEVVAPAIVPKSAQAIDSPANSSYHPAQLQLPFHWQAVQPPLESGSRPPNQQSAARWNSFQPPEQGVPGRREGGGTRGPECRTTALIPQSTMGRTVSEKPTFFYHVPAAIDKKVEFELADETDKTIYKKSFRMVTSGPGIVSISLAADPSSPPMDIGKNYHWYFTIKCNPKNPREDVLVSGWIERVELSPTLKTQLAAASDRDRLSIFAQQALWYEYLGTLAQLRLSSPRDAALTLKWSELLHSVALGKIAQQPLIQSKLTPASSN
ncbi:MAG: DUF928 domain-containing protein [Microcoleus sp.]